MIKVLYVISSFMRCGPINMFYTLVSNLDFDKFEIHVITLKDEPPDSRIEDFTELGVKVHRVGAKNSHMLFGLASEIRKTIDKVKPNIIHSHGPWADYYTAKQRDYITVANIHNKLADDYIPLYGRVIGTVTTWMDARSMRRMSKCISVSKSVEETARTQYGITSDVIINGIDTEKYARAADEEKLSLRAALDLPQSSFIFVHVGNLIERKQPLLLEQAFMDIPSDVRDRSSLLFLGDGPLMNSCIEYGKDTPNILFRGNVKNIEMYLRASDCMVSATLSDGMSMATLEGMACGLTCIMSDIDVHREIAGTFVSQNEDFLIIENRTEAFTNAFINAICRVPQSNSINPAALSGKRMSQEYAKLYERLYVCQ